MDAEKYLPNIFKKHGLDWNVGVDVLNRLPVLVQRVEFDVYGEFGVQAKKRIRDVCDLPVLATALA